LSYQFFDGMCQPSRLILHHQYENKYGDYEERVHVFLR